MTKISGAAPFSLAIAFPSDRKPLVERMVRALQRQTTNAPWYLTDATNADVVLRAADGAAADGAGGFPGAVPDLSPSLLADVRRPDGGVDVVRIDAPWRPGVFVGAMENIARIVRTEPDDALDMLAWQWLQRWSALAASDARTIEWRIGGRLVALLDPRASTWHRSDDDVGDDAAQLLAAMAREGYTLTPTTAALPAQVRQLPAKALLWQFGVRAGNRGPLPALAAYGALKLKGWPYLAAGGPKIYAALIAQLRGGVTHRASLFALAPASVVYGFLNACCVCAFFHDDAVAAAVPAVATPAMPAAGAPNGTQAVIASIRRSLGAPAT